MGQMEGLKTSLFVTIMLFSQRNPKVLKLFIDSIDDFLTPIKAQKAVDPHRETDVLADGMINSLDGLKKELSEVRDREQYRKEYGEE